METRALPLSDCHHYLRQELLNSVELGEPLNISVAWDWQFAGHTKLGVAKEHAHCVYWSHLNAMRNVTSIAIPGVCILNKTRNLLALHDCAGCEPQPPVEDELLTLLPMLEFLWIWDTHTLQSEHCNKAKTDFEIAKTDPFGVDGYNCQHCQKELFHAYHHCMGCELRHEDYNVCAKCYSEGRHRHSRKPSRKSNSHKFELRFRLHHNDFLKKMIDNSKHKIAARTLSDCISELPDMRKLAKLTKDYSAASQV